MKRRMEESTVGRKQTKLAIKKEDERKQNELRGGNER
jgi:hypothetical protein